MFQEIGSSLLGGSYEYGGSAFVPAEIRHTFRSAGEKFLQRVCVLTLVFIISYIVCYPVLYIKWSFFYSMLV